MSEDMRLHTMTYGEIGKMLDSLIAERDHWKNLYRLAAKARIDGSWVEVDDAEQSWEA